MSKSTTNKQKHRQVNHRLSARALRVQVEMLQSSSQRTAATIEALWDYVLKHEHDGNFGIIEGVLNRQITETRAIAGGARLIAEHLGLTAPLN